MATPPGRSAPVEGYRAEKWIGCRPMDSIIIPAIDVPIDFPALTHTFTTAIWRDWGHGELFFQTCPRTFHLSYTTARPILFCTYKSIRTRYPWDDALLHHLALTISNNNEITTYRKKSVSLRAGSSSRVDDDTYTTNNAHNAAGYAFSGTKYISGARTFTSPRFFHCEQTVFEVS